MDVKLIEHVRNYPVLYDTSYKDYTNQEARRNAWDEIGEQIGCSGHVCKVKWTKLRNAYTNALRRRKPKPGESPKNTTKWKLEDQMSFLGLHMGSRSVDCGDSADEIYPDSFKTDDNSVQDPSGDVSNRSRALESANSQITPIKEFSSSLPPPSPSTFYKNPVPTKGQNGRKRRLVESTMDEMVQIMKENNRLHAQYEWTPPESAQQNSANDETELLFLSLARTVKKLSQEEQAQVKMEIANVVFQAEFRHAQCFKTDPYQPNSPYSNY